MEARAPGAGEVEIQVQYAAVNFRDVLKCLGLYPADSPEELVLGDECAGMITAIGPGVSAFEVGDRVVACARGCFQSRVIAPAAMLLPVPPVWGTSEAATVPIAFLTAWYALRTVGRLVRGESVLIHAAAGGVGLAAIQIAQLAGARIFATAGTDEKRRMLRDLGCELVMDSRSLAFADQVGAHTQGRGVDVILNSLAGEAMLQSVRCLAPYGRFLEIGKRDLFEDSKLGLWPLRFNGSFHAIDLGAVLAEKPVLAGQLLSDLKTAINTRMIRPLPHRVWPASQIADAFRTMSQGKHTGKLVVDLRDPKLEITGRNVPRVSFRAEATYIISGGLSGFGLEAAKWIVRRGGKYVALLSRRSAESEGVQAVLAELRSLGAEPQAISCDVADRRQVAGVIEHLRSTSPPVRGVFHAAMVIDDAPLVNLNAARLRTVLWPKALGAWNLHQETHDLPLDHFVLFSSISASIGNRGQGNYAAANAMLEGLAAYRRSLGLPGTAIGWGFVSEAGFAAQRADLLKHAERQGFLGSTPAEHLDVLERLLARSCTTAVVGDFKWQAVANSFFKTGPPRGLMTSLVAEFAGGAGAGSIDTLRIREELEAAAPGERMVLLRDYLRSQVARILGVTAAKVDVDRPILELGLDSLMGIELAVVVERDLAVTLPALTVSRDLTVSRLVQDTLQQMGYAPPKNGVVPVHASRGQASPFPRITPLRAGGSKPPLICFHPIGGGVRGYEPLTDALDASIPVFGVQSRMLAGEDEYTSLDTMAAAYTDEVRAFRPAGPYWLFGFSLGGYLAASVAQRLEAAGHLVDFVGVADCPDYTERVTTDTQGRFARLIASSYQAAAADLPFLKPLKDSNGSSFRHIAEKLIQRPEKGPEMLLEWLADHGCLAGSVPRQTILEHLRRLSSHLLLVGTSLERPVVRGSLFVWQATRGIGVGTDVWRRAENLPVSVVVVEADHATLMNPPALQVIARQLNRAYDETERSHASLNLR